MQKFLHSNKFERKIANEQEEIYELIQTWLEQIEKRKKKKLEISRIKQFEIKIKMEKLST